MSQQRLISDIERACQILRSDNNCAGMMDYIHHLSWLLFLKLLDSKYSTATANESKSQHPLEPMYRWSEWVPKALSASRERNYYYNSTREDSDLLLFIKEELFPYLANLSGSPQYDLIAGIFKEPYPVICASADNLKEVIKIIDALQLEQGEELEVLAQGYEIVLQKLGAGGEFYTPPEVVSLMVKTINPQLGEFIYDPNCGSGTFLTAAYNHLKRQVQNQEQIEKLEQTSLVGHVKNAMPALFSSLNASLHGSAEININRKNALEEDAASVRNQFDIILMNPPFGRSENKSIQQNFPIKSSASELLFLQHSMSKLSPRVGARCSVILPDGILFRREKSFTAVKKELLDSFNLFMVISLPAGIFTQSTVKTSIVIFYFSGPTKEVLYYEIPVVEKNKLTDHSIPETFFNEAIDVYHQWKRYLDGNGPQPQRTPRCWIETREALIERGYDLSAKNPTKHRDNEPKLPHPVEITTALLERHRNFYQVLEHLHQMIRDQEDACQ